MFRVVGNARCVRPRAARPALHWLTALGILAADPLDAAAQTVAADAPAAITITVTDQAFQAPDTIPAGFTAFRLVNEGEQVHSVLLVRLEPGRSAEEFVEAYGAHREDGAERPAWASYHGGPGITLPRGESNAMLHLEPGSYLIFCGVPFPDGHLMKPHAFEVGRRSGNTSPPGPPEPTVSLQLLDYRFELSAPLTAGRHTIKVENVGAEPHHVVLVKLAPGKTMNDLQVSIRNPEEVEPPVTAVAGVSALSPGTETYFEADVSPGDYALFCVILGPDGREHIEHGMIQHIRIE